VGSGHCCILHVFRLALEGAAGKITIAHLERTSCSEGFRNVNKSDSTKSREPLFNF
jgi:hypothetical protein